MKSQHGYVTTCYIWKKHNTDCKGMLLYNTWNVTASYIWDNKDKVSAFQRRQQLHWKHRNYGMYQMQTISVMVESVPSHKHRVWYIHPSHWETVSIQRRICMHVMYYASFPLHRDTYSAPFTSSQFWYPVVPFPPLQYSWFMYDMLWHNTNTKSHEQNTNGEYGRDCVFYSSYVAVCYNEEKRFLWDAVSITHGPVQLSSHNG